jgi:hypothetical protein
VVEVVGQLIMEMQAAEVVLVEQECHQEQHQVVIQLLL